MNDTNTLSTMSITGSLDIPTIQKYNDDITLIDNAILKALNPYSPSTFPESTISYVDANMVDLFQELAFTHKSAINSLLSFFNLQKKNESNVTTAHPTAAELRGIITNIKSNHII